jgi:hypothetical protein
MWCERSHEIDALMLTVESGHSIPSRGGRIAAGAQAQVFSLDEVRRLELPGNLSVSKPSPSVLRSVDLLRVRFVHEAIAQAGKA